MRVIFLMVAILMVAATLPLSAQWLDYPDSKIPRTANGQPDLSAPARTLNGVPDLSGVWESERTPNAEYAKVLGEGIHDLEIDLYEVNKYLINVFWPLMPPTAGPFTPAGRAAMEAREQTTSTKPLPPGRAARRCCSSGCSSSCRRPISWFRLGKPATRRGRFSWMDAS